VKKIEQVYFKLQRHLDQQAVGFPATQSRVELKILKHIFTPQEAQIAIHLSYKFVPLDAVFDRVRHIVGSSEELKVLLDGSQKKGGVESKIKGGKRHYCLAPLVIGMYEMQLKRLTPEFIKDYNEYISDKKFGIDFISAKPPQTRTIPIAKSIHPQHHVSTFDEVAALLEQGEAPFAILECICRKKKVLEGGSCKITDRKETCLAIGHIAQHALMGDLGREITRDEAMSLLEENQKQ
jgi:electron transport complex protein RnfB